MSYDKKLIEAMAEAIFKANGGLYWSAALGETKIAYRRDAEAALAAIDASGTHWVALCEVTDTISMILRPRIDPLSGYTTDDLWAEVRDACLAERRKS